MFTEDNTGAATQDGGVDVVVGVLQTHADSPRVVEAVCAVLLSLAMEGTVAGKGGKGVAVLEGGGRWWGSYRLGPAGGRGSVCCPAITGHGRYSGVR